MEVSELDLLSLLRTIDTLKPYLDEIVVVGGWVPFLYRKYGDIPARHPSVRTTDIDIAVPRHVPDRDRPTVDNLLTKACYTVQIFGSYGGAVKYELAKPPTEIEFITPEIGKQGQPAIAVQNGLRAQALRYIQVLLDNTRQIAINDNIADLQISAMVKLPSPAAYIFQKVLTLPSRRTKAAKDLYYIFDLLDSSAEMQRQIPLEIKLLQAQYAPAWFRSAIHNLEGYFPESGGEGPALIASQYTGQMNIGTLQNYSQRTFRDLIERMQKHA